MVDIDESHLIPGLLDSRSPFATRLFSHTRSQSRAATNYLLFFLHFLVSYMASSAVLRVSFVGTGRSQSKDGISDGSSGI